MFKKIREQKYLSIVLFVLLTFGLYAFFYYLTCCTPLAGDDWGYALNGMKGNPFETAISFYQTWSGRFFSELWGFLVAPHKEVWNVLNPLFFTIIFVFGVLLSGCEKKDLFPIGLLYLTLMLNISEGIRMQTYTWIMGTTYVIPLALCFIYLYLVEKKILFNKGDAVSVFFSCLLCIYISLTMENIAAIMVFAQLLCLIFHYVKEKKINWVLLVNMILSLAGFLLMRASPGSSYRLGNDHPDWLKMSVFEQIACNLPYFVRFTFLENRYLIVLLSFVILVLEAKKWWKEKTRSSFVFIIFFFSSLILIASGVLVNRLNMTFLTIFTDPSALINLIYWLVYVGMVFLFVSLRIKDIYEKWKIIFFILIGGSCNVVMLFSPIFGDRSALYFVYCLYIVILLLFKELIREDDLIVFIFFFLCLLLTVRKGRTDLYKYAQVSEVQREREEIIEYYKDSEDLEMYIPRMPPQSIHSADVEEWDSYHEETFKAYYGLPDKKLIFYWKESY